MKLQTKVPLSTVGGKEDAGFFSPLSESGAIIQEEKCFQARSDRTLQLVSGSGGDQPPVTLQMMEEILARQK